ncbi:MAG TPA: phosphoribosyl-AMP cyclohydrolase [Thermomicrobiales bacterium]|nr:phosphoribosyl-AMP cyclohydrolase [Thermomicrobiales bacterium]
MTPDTTLPLRFGQDGITPAVIVDATSGAVLMVGFMNEEALQRTRDTGCVHFWSRSRQKLWKKGESSGHLQHVREVRVNCDQNSLLIEVDQDGAVCHDGYDTCYYRRLEPDNSLTIVRDRQFDPRDVYPKDGDPAGLATRTEEWWQAYEWLRDSNVEADSGTSKRLRADEDAHTPRLSDELRELAGVLDGFHRHASLDEDIRLESGQVLYWAVCTAVWQRLAWSDVRPDRALGITGGEQPSSATLSRLLTARADELVTRAMPPDAPLLHDTFGLVGTVLQAHDVDPLDVIKADLADLSAKPYIPRDQ